MQYNITDRVFSRFSVLLVNKYDCLIDEITYSQDINNINKMLTTEKLNLSTTYMLPT